jgi:hypothetical protein
MATRYVTPLREGGSLPAIVEADDGMYVLKCRGAGQGPKALAQFLAVCSSSILAETLSYAASFSSPWRGKRRVLERRKPLLTEQLQPSTNSDKLSDLCSTTRMTRIEDGDGLFW